MKTWKIPVSWEMSGFVNIEAPSLEKAIGIAATDTTIGLPEGSYLEDSWKVDAEDAEYVREVYNNKQQDEFDMCSVIEKAVYDWLSQQPRTLDIHSPDYKKIVNLVEIVCNEEFPELSESVFGSNDDNFIFRDRNNPGWYNLYYYNPDSSAGGQIVQCPFNELDAAEMMVNEHFVDVLADRTQYLSDVDTEVFFDTLFELIQMKREGLYLGNNVYDVCREILAEKNKSLHEVIDNAVERSAAGVENKDSFVKDVEKEFA